jgi:hypothetical protein
MSEELNVFQRLLLVQKEAVAPREISGKFGKGRSAEQILEAYKPICNKHGLFLNTSDTVAQVGERNYITATATVTNVYSPEETYKATASAWEGNIPLSNSGGEILDSSQVSGKTSSYAKKYALQNLFAIDDTKDADHGEPQEPVKAKPGREKEIAGELAEQFIAHDITSTESKSDFIQSVIQKDSITTVLDAKRVLKALKDLADEEINNDNSNQ